MVRKKFLENVVFFLLVIFDDYDRPNKKFQGTERRKNIFLDRSYVHDEKFRLTSLA